MSNYPSNKYSSSQGNSLSFLAKFVICFLAFLYVISPIDMVPDIIPILGWLDDVGVITWAIGMLNEGE